MSGSSSSSSSSSRSRGGNGGSGSAIDEGDEGLMMRFSRGSLGEFLGDTPLLGINFFWGGGSLFCLTQHYSCSLSHFSSPQHFLMACLTETPFSILISVKELAIETALHLKTL